MTWLVSIDSQVRHSDALSLFSLISSGDIRTLIRKYALDRCDRGISRRIFDGQR